MSDEDRLRDRLRGRAARVPDLSDIDDVATRLARRRPVRERRLLALVAVALVVGVGIGVVIGRDDDGRSVAVGSDVPAESTAAPTITTTVVTNTTLLPCSAYEENPPLNEGCSSAGPVPTLPPPGAEQPADPVAARAEVAQVWIDASDGASSNETRAAAIEGGAGLMPLFDELRNGPYGPQVRSAKTVIDEIVFVSPTRAAVKFHADLPDAPISGPYFVEAVLDENGWQATRPSYCSIVSLAGVHCPE